MKNQALLKLRSHLNYSQKEMGKQIDISQTRIYLYENGREIPSELAWKMFDIANSIGLEIPFSDFYPTHMKSLHTAIQPEKEFEFKFKCAELNLKIKDAVIEEQRKIITEIANSFEKS